MRKYELSLKDTNLKNIFPLFPLFNGNKKPWVSWMKEDYRIYNQEILDIVQGLDVFPYVTSKGKFSEVEVTGYGLVGGAESGIMMIDLDRKPAEDGQVKEDGIESLKSLCLSIGLDYDEAVDTFTVKTPNNGIHLYFQYEPDTLRHGAGILPGVDFRTDGGMIVLPGTKVTRENAVKNAKDLNFEQRKEIVTYEIIKDIPVKKMDEKLLKALMDAQDLKQKKAGKGLKTQKRMRRVGELSEANKESIFNQVKLAGIDDLYLSDIGFRGALNNTWDRGHGVCPIHAGAKKKDGFSYRVNANGWREYYCHTEHCVEAESILEVCRAVEGFPHGNEGLLKATMFLAERYNIDLIMPQVHENVNYSKFEPNAVYEINGHIGEEHEGVRDIFAFALDGKNSLFLADTGLGKTFSCINKAKEIVNAVDVKVLFVLPNSSNVAQVSQEYDVKGVWGEKSNVNKALEDEKIVVMTWNKFAKIKKESLHNCIAMFDEVHQTLTEMYRSDIIVKVMSRIPYCRAKIDITATPNKLNFKDYSFICQYKDINKIKVNPYIYDKYDLSHVIDTILESKKCIVQINNIADLNFIKESVKHEKVCGIVTSDNKEESEIMNSIIETSALGKYDVLLCTTCINAGINLNDLDITDVIIVNIKDITAPVQLVARARKVREINLHIYAKFKGECNTYPVENLLKKKINRLNLTAKNANDELAEDEEYFEDGLALGKTAYRMDGALMFDEEENKYIVNETLVRAKVYQKYISDRTIEKYAELLGEYFKGITVIALDDCAYDAELKEELKEIKANKKEAKDMTKDLIAKKPQLLVALAPLLLPNSKIDEGQACWYLADVFKMTVDEFKKNSEIQELTGIIKENKLGANMESFSELAFNYGYSAEVAWELARLSPGKRKMLTDSIENISKTQLLEENPKFFNRNRLENKLAFFLFNVFKPGKSFTQEHLEEVSEYLRENLADVEGVSPKKLKDKIKTMFKLNDKRYREEQLEAMRLDFVNDKAPSFDDKEKITVFTVVRTLTVEDIKVMLNVPEHDDCIEKKIEAQKEKEYIKNSGIERAKRELDNILHDNYINFVQSDLSVVSY